MGCLGETGSFVVGSNLELWLRQVRRHIHAHPELGFQEHKTAAFIEEKLDQIGVRDHKRIAETGVLAKIPGVQDENAVALRADMDALPLPEKTGLLFSSTIPGVMHACGHDGHVAMLLGAASLLHNTPLPGPVVLLFQPAEEKGTGARRVIAEGGLEGVEAIFSGHIDTRFPMGTLTVDEGIICSWADPFEIEVRGKSGHASRPQEAKDAIVAAADLVISMQNLVSRIVDPRRSAVVTVGLLQAGIAQNIIAEQAVLQGTIRSNHGKTRSDVLSGLERIVRCTASKHEVDMSLQFVNGLPAVVNDTAMAKLCRSVAQNTQGVHDVMSQGGPSLGSEDFSYYLREVPGAMVRFGAACQTPAGVAHSSTYDFCEDVLAVGAAWYANIALQWFAEAGAKTEKGEKNAEKRGIVASGHGLTSRAAAIMLREGGNAFDAIVAAGFASTVVEQTLTSLGGGGFLLGHSADKGQSLFFDFFVDTPGKGRRGGRNNLDFYPVLVQFSGTPQSFNIGLGSVAVPGVTAGLIHTHKRLGRMPIREVVAPAVEYAKGHPLNQFQASFLQLLQPIVTRAAFGRKLYEGPDGFIQENQILQNRALADFLLLLVEDGGASFYRGEIGRQISQDMQENGGLLSLADLMGYRVRERKPLRSVYRGYELLTAPPPSMGGALIAYSLAINERQKEDSLRWGSGKHLLWTLALMSRVEKVRKALVEQGKPVVSLVAGQDDANFEMPDRLFSRGTTHVSVSDRWGNCAAMTCSNGEGSGYFAPGTGVMLNNMMGEDDLHPLGFHSSPAGERVGSMMAPSLLLRDNKVELVLGSGGSKRIRTTMTQVITQIIDFKKSLVEAVNAPRLYYDGSCMQVEPGYTSEALAALPVE
ncbi:unnamed protein product, partial [Cyprideis torosa]